MRLLIPTLLFLSACSTTSGDMADAVTTSVALSSGATELNPLLPNDPIAGPMVLVLKEVGKHIMIEAGRDPEQVNAEMNATGWGAACMNLAVVAGATTGVGAAVGLTCAAVVWPEEKEYYCNKDKSKCWSDTFVCTDDACYDRSTGQRIEEEYYLVSE